MAGDGLLVGQQRDLVDDDTQARGVVGGVVPELREHRIQGRRGAGGGRDERDRWDEDGSASHDGGG